jgi:hypothetical protein
VVDVVIVRVLEERCMCSVQVICVRSMREGGAYRAAASEDRDLADRSNQDAVHLVLQSGVYFVTKWRDAVMYRRVQRVFA